MAYESAATAERGKQDAFGKSLQAATTKLGSVHVRSRTSVVDAAVILIREGALSTPDVGP